MRMRAAICATIVVTLALPISARSTLRNTAKSVALLIAQGNRYADSALYTKAVQTYKKAEKLSHHHCSECLLRESQIYLLQSKLRDALACAKKAQVEAHANKVESARALLMQANLLADMAVDAAGSKMELAISRTRQALALNPHNPVAKFNLSVLLARRVGDLCGTAKLAGPFDTHPPGSPCPANSLESGTSRGLIRGEVQVLSPVQNGVDLHPFTAVMLAQIQKNWYEVMPTEAIRGKKGLVAICFAVLHDGSLAAKPAITISSGDSHLDRAALVAIMSSEPLKSLPKRFRGKSVGFRAIFLYNEPLGTPIPRCKRRIKRPRQKNHT